MQKCGDAGAAMLVLYAPDNYAASEHFNLPATVSHCYSDRLHKPHQSMRLPRLCGQPAKFRKQKPAQNTKLTNILCHEGATVPENRRVGRRKQNRGRLPQTYKDAKGASRTSAADDDRSRCAGGYDNFTVRRKADLRTE